MIAILDGNSSQITNKTSVSNETAKEMVTIVENLHKVTVYPQLRRSVMIISIFLLTLITGSALVLLFQATPFLFMQIIFQIILGSSIIGLIVLTWVYLAHRYSKNPGRLVVPLVLVGLVLIGFGIYGMISMTAFPLIAPYFLISGIITLIAIVNSANFIKILITKYNQRYNQKEKNVSQIMEKNLVMQNSAVTQSLDKYYTKKHIYDEKMRWDQVGAHYIRFSMTRILREYGVRQASTYQAVQKLQDLYANRLEKRIKYFQDQLSLDGSSSLKPGSKEAKRLLAQSEDRIVAQTIRDFYEDLKVTLDPILNDNANQRIRKTLLNPEMIHQQLNLRMNIYRGQMIEAIDGNPQLNHVTSHHMQSSSLPNFTKRQDEDMTLYTNGTFSVEKLTPKFLKSVLSPAELKAEIRIYDSILNKEGFSKILNNKFNEVDDWKTTLGLIKKKKGSQITDKEYKKLAKMMALIGTHHRVWEMIEQMAKDELTKGTASQRDGPLAVNMVSVSLMTPDWFRHYIGGSDERKMLQNEMDALELFHGQEFNMPIGGRDVLIKPNINASIWPVNKYSQGIRARMLRLWNFSESYNQKAIVGEADNVIGMISRATEKIGMLKQGLADKTKSEEERVELQATITTIERLKSSLELGWEHKIHRKHNKKSLKVLKKLMSQHDKDFPIDHENNYDPYMMPKLMMHLGYYLDSHLCAHCKSGKDRSGELWAQVMLERVHQRNTGEPVVGAYNRLPSPKMSQTIASHYHETGNAYNQMMQTGLAGAKLQNAPVVVQARYESDELGFDQVAGYSEAVRNLFAVQVAPSAWTAEGTTQQNLSEVLDQDIHEEFYEKVKAVLQKHMGDEYELPDIESLINQIQVVSDSPSRTEKLRGAYYERSGNEKPGTIFLAKNEIEQYLNANAGAEKEGAIAWLANAVIGHEFLHQKYDHLNSQADSQYSVTEEGAILWEEAYVVSNSLNAQESEVQGQIGEYMEKHADAVVGSHDENTHRAAMKLLKNIKGTVSREDVLNVMIGVEVRTNFGDILAPMSDQTSNENIVKALADTLDKMHQAGILKGTPITIPLNRLVRNFGSAWDKDETSALLMLKAIEAFNKDHADSPIAVEILTEGPDGQMGGFRLDHQVMNQLLKESSLKWEIPSNWFVDKISDVENKVEKVDDWSSWFASLSRVIGSTLETRSVDPFIGFEHASAEKSKVTSYLDGFESIFSKSA